jgi:hypothetical protein
MGNNRDRFFGIVFISILFFFLTVEGVMADKVILENGDTLTGTVEKMTEGKLTFKTDYAGTIEIQPRESGNHGGVGQDCIDQSSSQRVA